MNFTFPLFQSPRKIAQQKRNNNELPAFMSHYYDAVTRFNPNTPISEVRFVVFDTETTGLNPKVDEIISIGAVAVQHMAINVSDSLEIMVNSCSQQQSSHESVEVHQILNTELVLAQNDLSAVESFISFCKGDVLVAHFVEFDSKMVSKLIKRHFQFPLISPLLDTIQLARRLDDPFGNSPHKQGAYSLDTLCEKYDLSISSRHTASGDALATAELLLILLRQAEKKGIYKIGDLLP